MVDDVDDGLGVLEFAVQAPVFTFVVCELSVMGILGEYGATLLACLTARALFLRFSLKACRKKE